MAEKKEIKSQGMQVQSHKSSETKSHRTEKKIIGKKTDKEKVRPKKMGEKVKGAKRVQKKEKEELKEKKIIEKKEKEELPSKKEGEKAKIAEENLPVEKVRGIPIEKIKFYGKKPLSNDEGENINFIIAKKKKKPKFLREEMYKVRKLKAVWRRRRGIDSKKAVEKRGKGEIPKIGYKNPDSIIGIDPSGYYPILVHNYGELQALNPAREAAIISGVVGRRKRNEIIKMANDLKITVLNPRKGEI